MRIAAQKGANCFNSWGSIMKTIYQSALLAVLATASLQALAEQAQF